MTAYLTPVTLAARWDRTAEWVRRSANAGVIPGIKVGGLWRFDPADITSYEQRHKTADPMSTPPSPARGRRTV